MRERWRKNHGIKAKTVVVFPRNSHFVEERCVLLGKCNRFSIPILVGPSKLNFIMWLSIASNTYWLNFISGFFFYCLTCVWYACCYLCCAFYSRACKNSSFYYNFFFSFVCTFSTEIIKLYSWITFCYFLTPINIFSDFLCDRMRFAKEKKKRAYNLWSTKKTHTKTSIHRSNCCEQPTRNRKFNFMKLMAMH